MMRVRLRRTVLAASVIGVACSGATLPPKGQLMIVVSTNLAPPKDFDSFHLRVEEDGEKDPPHDKTYEIAGSQPTKLPATLGIVVGGDPTKTLHITLEATRGGVVRVKREAFARVPATRIAALPLPIDGLCIESGVCPPGADGKPQTCVAGTCQPAEIDSDKLPTYSAGDVFGGGTGDGDGLCFDTLACFGASASAAVRASDCSVAKQLGGAGFNVAVLRPATSDGICAANGCLVPIDRDPFPGSDVVSGWREAYDRVLVPKAICERSLPLLVTTSCPTKNAPPCGTWSAVGGGSGGADASIPFDASTLPFGDGGTTNVPAGVAFADADPQQGKVTGTVTIVRAPDESGITGYELYWGDGPTKKLDRIATLPKTGANLTYLLSGDVLGGASHLIAQSVSGTTAYAPAVSTGPIDNYPRFSPITLNGVDIDFPTTLVDAAGQRVLIVGFDAAAKLPALVHCKLDGSSCVYRDVSAGQPSGNSAGTWNIDAAIDTDAQKLLFVADRSSSAYVAHLFRCDLDGGNCTAKDISTASGLSIGSAARSPLVIDSVNKKALFVVNDNFEHGYVIRCDLDGNDCTYPNYAANVGGRAIDAVIDSAASKLLIARLNYGTPNLAPSLYRCDLDATGCTLSDISAGRATGLATLSIAIDAENQKLLVIGNESTATKVFLYRCNLDGTACATKDLEDPAITSPSDPRIVIDAAHHVFFVFGSTASLGYAMRCALDGTSCTSTILAPAGSTAGNRPTAFLHEGRFFVASSIGANPQTGPGNALISVDTW